MSGPSTNPENDLSSTLARQAEQFARRGGADLDLAQVVSRAGEIRRGRRMRATMAMAAVVLAVAVPVGVTVLNDPTTPGGIVPAIQPDNSPITLAGLETGDKPDGGYAEAGRLQPGSLDNSLPDGQEPAELAQVGEDFLIGYQDDQGELVARYITFDGVVGTDVPASYGFGVSPGGGTAAVVGPDGTVVAFQDRGTKQVEVGQVPAAGSYTVSGIRGRDCSPGGDCTVYVSTNDEDPKLWAVAPGTAPRVVHPGLQGAASLSNQLVAGNVSVTSDGSCSQVRNDGDEVQWETCESSLVAFSPGGRHIAAKPAYYDGLGVGQLTILDAQDGARVLDLRTVDGATITSTTWDGDDHILATITEKGAWAVVRFSLDGNRELALGPIITTDDLRPPFFLAGQR